ncbi:hypothetical protein BU26DRAFT_297218 [Trematosphaeria pertusa]|uniref:Uncharacterized protein n=1 Tax=Trematosphaeria pertusa TaxID=390896 RepID=A0A6A6IHX2_9PLEO|nr:uncharacterized protein BU26DRAFT_297218 [Trematosphaeria pertusa]KAF2250215.1 hypothetical protein BU26DRAFT_297218 [Trematosphaeria pertusa]
MRSRSRGTCDLWSKAVQSWWSRCLLAPILVFQAIFCLSLVQSAFMILGQMALWCSCNKPYQLVLSSAAEVRLTGFPAMSGLRGVATLGRIRPWRPRDYH